MKVIICDRLEKESIDKMREEGIVPTIHTGMTPAELVETIPAYHIMIVRGATKVTREVINAASNLKLIVRPGVGLENIDKTAAKERGITVKNTPIATTISVAEHTFGLILALARHVPQGDHAIRNGIWDRKKYTGAEVHGKTLGLIGFGRIGQEVALRALSFGMKVVANDPFIDSKSVRSLNIPLIDLDELLKTSDYISLHVPFMPTTTHMIDSHVIDKMKQGVRIINCSRGGIVDEEALAAAIKTGQVAGAAFDVFEKEPPDRDNPLLKLDSFICSPHIGAYTAEGQARASEEAARIVIEFVRRSVH